MGALLGGGRLLVLAFATVISPAALVFCGISPTLTLERAFPSNHRVELGHLRARDRVRHGRILQSTGGVVDFPVEGTYNPYLVGLYFTTVQLGSPPREFYVQIDTGSDVLWVSCNSCNGCPQSSGLAIQLKFFDPSSSTSASQISCSDQRCSLGVQAADSGCSTQNNVCSYSFQYGDGSGTSGYYVSDLLHFDTIVGSSLISNSTAAVVFGCSTSQTGDLTKSDRAVDGIFGFGQQDMSVISQLHSQGVTPKVFSHCLKGDSNGGGVLVLGEIVEPGIVYTSLVPSQPHYNLNLETITVNGQVLPIASSVFSTSSNSGTIVDSGTTLAYLAEEAYDPLVSAIKATVQQYVSSSLSKGNQCFSTSSVSDIFPTVSLNFAGGASMILRPQDYLIQQNSIDGGAVWCIGFQRMQGQAITILGDLVLKDKIVVYDLAGQRIGWVNYDCSQSVNVSTTSSNGKSEFVNAGQISQSSTLQSSLYYFLPRSIAAVFFLHITLFSDYLYL